MPPAGKHPRTARRSKREQVVQAAAAEAPLVAEPLPLPPEMPPSPIAEWLLDSSAANWSRLQLAASMGRLTKADVLSGLAAEMKNLTLAMDLHDFDERRKGYVMRHRLLSRMLDVVKQSVSSGPLQVVRMVWPSHYEARDPGEDVRMENPEEA